MLLGKSIEITLKEIVFDVFQSKYDSEILQEKGLSIFLKQNEKVSQLAKYIDKELHHIEL